MFQLDAEEFDNLKSHFVISSSTWGGRYGKKSRFEK